MGTISFFDETIRDQGGKGEMQVEIARSSFYSSVKLPAGIGTDSIMLDVDGKKVIMDRETAKKFVDAVMEVGTYLSLLD